MAKNTEEAKEFMVEQFPHTSICPICGTNRVESAVLVPIDGTIKDDMCEAQPMHLKCINPRMFRFNREHGLLYVKLYSKEEYDAHNPAE